MIQRRTALLFLILLFGYGSSSAQHLAANPCHEVNCRLRFLPTRITNHVRTIREYEPSTTVMGRRELRATTYYSRQGHMVYHRRDSEMPDSILCTYDTLDRLVQWKRLDRRWDNDSQRMVWGSIFVETIEYSPDGLVSLCHYVAYDRVGMAVDTTVVSHRLIHLVRSTPHGVTECDYAYYERTSHGGIAEELFDTCRYRRRYDEEGRLMWEYYADEVGSRGLDNYEHRYAYDTQGRRLYTISRYYGGYDSIGYRYSALGGVVEMSGKAWGEGFETDVFISCRPDGTPLESTEISYPQEWDYGANPEHRSITRKWYNALGLPIREESDERVVEYDYEYWDN